jgi:hypothetical protein
MDDVLAIADLVRAVHKLGRGLQGNRTRVSVSVATFIPKPHTPFQWLPMADAPEVAARQAALRQELRSRGVELSWSDEATTWLEGVLSRGDRRLGPVIRRACQLGARFDAWAEAFRPQLWQQAFAEVGIDSSFYSARERPRTEVMPWDHIQTGVSREFLWEEYQRSLRAETSTQCRAGCLTCGVRDWFALDRCPMTTEG